MLTQRQTILLAIAAVLLAATIALRWKRHQAAPTESATTLFAIIKPDAVAAGKAPEIINVK